MTTEEKLAFAFAMDQRCRHPFVQKTLATALEIAGVKEGSLEAIAIELVAHAGAQAAVMIERGMSPDDLASTPEEAERVRAILGPKLARMAGAL